MESSVPGQKKKKRETLNITRAIERVATSGWYARHVSHRPHTPPLPIVLLLSSCSRKKSPIPQARRSSHACAAGDLRPYSGGGVHLHPFLYLPRRLAADLNLEGSGHPTGIPPTASSTPWLRPQGPAGVKPGRRFCDSSHGQPLLQLRLLSSALKGITDATGGGWRCYRRRAAVM